MKKILLLCVAALTAFSAMAQDINQATESYNNGAMELQMGNNAAALDYFKSALTMGEALGEDGAELVNNCKKAIASTSLSMAKDLYNAKDFAGAAEAFKQAKEIAEGYGEAEIAAEAGELVGQANLNLYNQAGKDALKAKDFAGAIENFTKVVELDPANGTAALQLGQAYMNTGNTDEAVKFLTAFQRKPRADLLQNGLVGSPCSPRDSQESSRTPQFKSINSSALSLLYSPTLTSIHDHRKIHSLD